MIPVLSARADHLQWGAYLETPPKCRASERDEHSKRRTRKASTTLWWLPPAFGPSSRNSRTTTTPPQRLPRGGSLLPWILESGSNRIRISIDYTQIGARDIVGNAQPALPILQGIEIDPEPARKLRLLETEPFAQCNEARGAEGAGELLVGQGLSVGVRQRGSFDLLIGHFIDPVPVGSARRLRVNSGPVAYKLFFHGGLLSSH
jgi:hypothetical protein